MQKVGENAYRIELSRDMIISAIFNVGDLTPNIRDDIDYNEDLRQILLKVGG